MIGSFSKEALAQVQAMFAENQPNPHEGECGQKKLREQNKTDRSPEEKQADADRAQANRGQDNVPSATRSEAAKKAAETKSKCKGNESVPKT